MTGKSYICISLCVKNKVTTKCQCEPFKILMSHTIFSEGKAPRGDLFYKKRQKCRAKAIDDQSHRAHRELSAKALNAKATIRR